MIAVMQPGFDRVLNDNQNSVAVKSRLLNDNFCQFQLDFDIFRRI